MSNAFEKFFSETFPYKYWNIKDTYVVTPITEGNWWPLKKYIVIYTDILVNRNEVDRQALKKMYENFEKFVNSFPDGEYKKRAHDYFLKDFDVDNMILLRNFCDEEGQEDTARKFYATRLMGGGGQSGVKQNIKEWVDDNKTFSEIIKQIPVAQDNLFQNGKLSKKQTTQYYLDDFHGYVSRNGRQVLSKWGFLPPESDGITTNQISEIIYHCDSEIQLISIADHQKLKLRLGNPFNDKMINYKKPSFNKENFNIKMIESDFNVNPFIALMEIFNKLLDLDKENWFISINEYQHIISRISPFNLNECVDLILDLRSNNQINFKELEKRKKQRNFSPKKVGGGFVKPLVSLLYGYMTKKERKSDFRSKNTNAFIVYGNSKFTVTNKDDFKKYFKIITKCKDHLNNTYQDLYKNISNDYEIFLNNEMINLGLLRNFQEKNYYGNSNQKDFTTNYLNGWQRYLQSIDTRLLDLCTQMNCQLLPYDIQGNNYISDLEINKEDSAIINISPLSTIIGLIKRSGYETHGENKIKKDRSDFNKIKPKIWKDRKNGIFHRKNFNKDNLYRCDSCELETKKLELHHIIYHQLDGPDVDLNLVYLCKKCHDKITYNTKKESQNDGNNRESVINNLKRRRLISFQNFETLLHERKINQIHLDFLQVEKYISFVEWMDLKKIRRSDQKKEDRTTKTLSKSNLINKRWSRPMKEVLKFRKQEHYINGKRDFHYPIDKCDGGCGTSIKEYVECHHVIPKSGSTNKKFKESYGDIPLNGPESEYNYVYLCKECHLKFTNHDPERKKIIEEIKNRGLISYQGILMMIYSGLVKKEQINFLFKEGFIDKSDFDNLIIELNDYLQNQLN